jgi:hypothetical protein
MVVPGATVSTIHVYEAGLGSALPARSVPRTWNVWLPSPSPEKLFGLEQDENVAPSNEHSNAGGASVEVKENVAPVAVVVAGGFAVIVVLGGVASIVQLWELGVGSTLPEGSTARAWNVCAPSATDGYVFGLGQAANGAPSRLHSKVEPGSVPESPKLGLEELESAGGLDVIEVFGGAVSIDQLYVVAVPGLPARSATAFTSKLWGPSASGPYPEGLPHAAKAAASTRHW